MGGSSGADGPHGGVDWEPWPSVPPVPDDVCQVTLFHGGDARSPPVPADIEIREFDPVTGIMTSRLAPFGDQPAGIAYSVFNPRGSGVGGCILPNYGCTEWVRDEHDSVIAIDYPSFDESNFTLSALDAATFGTRPHESVSMRFTVRYDADGTLFSGGDSNCCGYPERTFTEDAQHRCKDVKWQNIDGTGYPKGTTELDHWTWEGDRLVARATTNGADPTQILSAVSYAYDADGTLSATVVDGFAPLAQVTPIKAVHDGVVDYVVRTVALPDGSRWIEAIEFWSSVAYMADANVVRNGQLTPARRLRWNRSPGCRGLPFPRRTSSRCRFEPVDNQLSVYWDDPFTTPIPW